MKKLMLLRTSWVCLLGFIAFSCPVQGQLNTGLDRVFQNILGDSNGEGGALATVAVGGSTQETHATHFKNASQEVSEGLTPALNRTISGNVSSFPLSSTAAGVTFDFSSGQPVSITESLGPIFAETGKTLGKGKINTGVNYTYLDMSSFRGLPTSEMDFVFAHIDVFPQGLGDSPNESDLLNINLDLDVNAQIFAFFATMGITENLNVGVAVPVISVGMDVTADARISSFTFPLTGSPNHHFGSVDDPTLEHTETFSESAVGLGDITLRFKYSLLQGEGANVAVLLDTRLPTGDADNFLGTGTFNGRLLGILSKKYGDFTPHLNLGYDYRPIDLDSDELEFAIGFDQKIASGFTFAFDILGEIDLQSAEAIDIFSGQYSISDQVPQASGETLELVRTVDRSNIPVRDNDHLLNAAIGFRFAPSDRLIFLANTLIPLNDGGLRSNIVPTVGLAISF